jgi:hypothetical protein
LAWPLTFVSIGVPVPPALSNTSTCPSLPKSAIQRISTLL